MKNTSVRILTFFLLLIACPVSPVFAIASYPFFQNIEAIIFDCDGVLVDTEYLKFLAWQHALETKKVEFIIEEYRPLVGHSSKNILQMIREAKGIDIDEEVIEVRNAKYRVLQEQGVPPLIPMIEFAGKLSQKREKLGFKLGLASSASQEEILNNLKQIGLSEAFDLIISGSDDLNGYVDEEGKNKPKPYIYIESAKRLGVSPSHCLVFEDTTAGIEAAFKAGMVVVAVPNQLTLNQDFSKAAQIMYSYKNLPNFEE